VSDGADLVQSLRARYGGLVDRVLRRFPGPSALEVFEKVGRGDAQLFDATGSVIVTELLKEQDGLVCKIWLAAGELEPLLTRHEDICAWARSIGCSRMRISGRRGWIKFLPSYRETAVVMEMSLGGGFCPDAGVGHG
jgi:hypothetical protein